MYIFSKWNFTILVVVQFVLISLALSRDTTKSLVRSSIQICSLIWSDFMSNTVACAFSYYRLRFLLLATAIYVSSQKRFNSPSSSSFFQYFHILRVFIIKNPSVFLYHLFKLMDFLFRFLFIDYFAIQIFCNCINLPLQILHFRNSNVILWRHGLCLNLQICHTTFN